MKKGKTKLIIAVLLLVCGAIFIVNFRGGGKTPIDNTIMTVPYLSEKYYGDETFGLMQGDEFPIKIKDGILWLSNGSIDMHVPVLNQLLNKYPKQNITLAFTTGSEVNKKNKEIIRNSQPHGTTIIETDETIQDLFKNYHQPILYYVKDNIIQYRIAPWTVSDWETTVTLLTTEVPKQELILRKGESFGDGKVTFQNLKLENCEISLSNYPLIIALSPSCSVCLDMVTWLQAQNWPITPLIIISTSELQIPAEFRKFALGNEDISFDQEAIVSLDKDNIIIAEKLKYITDSLAISDFKENVYIDDKNIFSKLTGITSYPYILVFDNEKILREKLFLVKAVSIDLVNMKKPIDICEAILGK